MPNNQEMAQALLNYPTSDDAKFARKQDWSYGQPYAPYFEGKRFTSLMGSPNALPLSTHTVSTNGFQETAPELGSYYAKAALAANRSPLAALGFDPTKTAVDLGRDPSKTTLAGAYTPKYDQIYANGQLPAADAIVHESMHRGIQKLKESSLWNREWPAASGSLFNENIVRKLMHDKSGDPEGHLGPEDAKQRADALSYFSNPNSKKIIDDMEAAAAQLIAKQRPRGPR